MCIQYIIVSGILVSGLDCIKVNQMWMLAAHDYGLKEGV